MKRLFSCEVEYIHSPHVLQLYAGFIELQNKGIIDLKFIKKTSRTDTMPFVHACVNEKYSVIYDEMDGYLWIEDSVQKNLEYFKSNFHVDYYFKRSFNKELKLYSYKNRKIYPLGLNYNIQPDSGMFNLYNSLSEKTIHVLKSNSIVNKLTGKKYYYSRDFESEPILPEENRILFLTRLWDPEETKLLYTRSFREQINQTRIESIQACKKEFGTLFTGGLYNENYARKYCKKLIAPAQYSDKSRFLQVVKSHSICIATSGLHKSIGWKMGEYVAASRAIVSEPLYYELPGSFLPDQNYVEFTNKEELIGQISFLLDNPETIRAMMIENYNYYNAYVQPAKRVLNSLLTMQEANTETTKTSEPKSCVL